MLNISLWSQKSKNNDTFTKLDLKPIFDRMKPMDGNWQPVSGTKHPFEVFSAFLDLRKERAIVRIIGATKAKETDEVFCRFYFDKGSNNYLGEF